ncbi:Signal transduction histidine kinase [Micromonospora sediminicola]|uniref:histidine kinase n=1 Tax=Micromonospora sediminicola TaxID=946078 RepID=A0A1A9BE61_9ACTN|nr:histidine kinase [Micromonospora sediminicola]SBT67254.1 Signal transduction histidine kinase [Micromonospora sediminicola]
MSRVRGIVATGPLPRPGWRALLLDAALAAVLGLVCFQAATDDAGVPPPLPPPLPPLGTLPEVRPAEPGSSLGALLLVFVMCAPLVLRRRYPLAVLWATMAAASLVLATDGTRQPNLFPCVVLTCLVAVYSAAAHSPYRLPALASVPVAALLAMGLRELMLVPVPADRLPFVLLAPLVAAAGGHHVWRRRAGEDQQRLTAEARAHEEALRDAVAGERARIARELHDVVTHHVSVMVIQAGAARTVLAAAPDQAREALLAVESTGRSALTELRHVMGLLAQPEPGDPEDPQPGIEGLPELIERVRDAGVPVRLTISGQRRPVTSGVGLTAYRVVQEALTNMVRHAPGAAGTVVVEYAPQTLRIEVGNTEPDIPAVTGPTGGRGLIGLRERLAVYGGTLRSGARPGAGYHVEALIPWEAT